MKILYSWLRKYHKTASSVDETSELITSLGTDIESVETYPEIDSNITTAEIVEVLDHPNADKLKLAKINFGDDEVTVVCGAPNIEPGQIVPYAKVGARIGDIEISEVEIRGVNSPGMLLSERELGLSDDHAGIKIFKEGTPIGLPVSELLSEDYVLDAEVTPNRGDLLSHFGMARDLEASNLNKLEKEPITLSESNKQVSELFQVAIESENCHLYLSRVIEGVEIKKSPQWLRDELIACGVKPINNIVDVTNYIMLDLGHPLHAFDKEKISKNKIIVKDVEAETEVMCLDDKPRALLPGMLSINDADGPIAIAGVMGLRCSEIDENTKDVALEAAVFNPKSIRKTSKLLGLRTEASYRFERGVDDKGVGYAIDKAAKMIADLSGGKVAKGVMKAGEASKKVSVPIEYEKVNKLLGYEFEKARVDEILSALGFEIQGESVYVPSWRHDISSWQDLAEEVSRIEGLEKINPQPLDSADTSEASDYYKKEVIKDCLVGMGLTQAINYTFLSDEDVSVAKLDTNKLLEVANPVQEENRYLRNSLIPGLLKSVSRNPSFDDIELFEMGHVFSKEDEWETLAIITSGKNSRSASKVVDNFCKELGLDKNKFKVYEIDREDLKRFKIKKPKVSVAEVRLSEIMDDLKMKSSDITTDFGRINYRPASKYPPVSRDLSIVLDSKHSLEEVKKAILSASQKVVLAESFDEFESDRFGKNKKSVAFHIYLQKMDGTLSDQEADKEINSILSKLSKELGAKIRG